MPLFVRNNFTAEADSALAQAQAARIEADAEQASALQRIRAAIVQYRRAQAAWQRWSALSSTRIESGIELLDKVWRAREISTADYLIQLKQLLDGRAAGEELRTQAWLAWAEWIDSSGQWERWLGIQVAAASTTGK
jgi:cobalt-zinc-cadmium efflux system outer membrane protein